MITVDVRMPVRDVNCTKTAQDRLKMRIEIEHECVVHDFDCYLVRPLRPLARVELEAII